MRYDILLPFGASKERARNLAKAIADITGIATWIIETDSINLTKIEQVEGAAKRRNETQKTFGSALAVKVLDLEEKKLSIEGK